MTMIVDFFLDGDLYHVQIEDEDLSAIFSLKPDKLTEFRTKINAKPPQLSPGYGNDDVEPIWIPFSRIELSDVIYAVKTCQFPHKFESVYEKVKERLCTRLDEFKGKEPKMVECEFFRSDERHREHRCLEGDCYYRKPEAKTWGNCCALCSKMRTCDGACSHVGDKSLKTHE